MAKHITLDQLQTVVSQFASKNDARFLQLANAGALATKNTVSTTDIDTAFSNLLDGKANSSTTLAGYGITDAYTKTAVDDAIAASISAVYKPAGSKTADEVLALNLSDAVLGNVYNLTTAITTTALFVEGAGNTYPAGSNVVVVNTGTAESPVYKLDMLPGFVDLSGYATTSTATQSANGLMSAADKTKLDSFVEAETSDITTLVNSIYAS